MMLQSALAKYCLLKSPSCGVDPNFLPLQETKVILCAPAISITEITADCLLCSIQTVCMRYDLTYLQVAIASHKYSKQTHTLSIYTLPPTYTFKPRIKPSSFIMKIQLLIVLAVQAIGVLSIPIATSVDTGKKLSSLLAIARII